MIVVDASVLVELLIAGEQAEAIDRALAGQELAAPDLLDAEVLHALRGLERGEKLSAPDARRAVRHLGSLPVDRVPLALLHHPVWELRQALSTYDAAYVVLAARLGCGLLTRDRKLAAGAPPGVPITVI